MASSRDQKLAAKLRAKQGDNYQSASDRAAARNRQMSADASSATTPDPSATYDQVRSTPDSRQRRARAKSSDTISRWRRSVSEQWNR